MPELREALEWARVRERAWRVLGGGSNVVIADAGFAGLVIELALTGVDVQEHGDTVDVRVAAGESWDDFVATMVDRGYQGLECLSGIPGRVGATPLQNVGAYGQEVSETLKSVVTFDSVEQRARIFSAEECRFTYRDSWFKSVAPGRFIVTEVVFRLRRGAAAQIRYAELGRFLAEHASLTPSLADVRQAVLRLRRAKSMLLDASDPNCRSCGSFFVNPLLGVEQLGAFLARAPGEADVPQFPQADGRVKLSAGWLIEHAGFPRGTRDGNVGLSTKHALAIVAHAGASALDVTLFARRVQQGVRERFGVELEPEPVFWGT